MAVIEIVGGVILLVVSVVIFALTLMQHTHGQGLAGAARYSQSFIEHELLLNSSRLKITTGSNDKIVCTEVYGNRQVTFYRSGGALAREIKYNSTRGVNPLSLAEVTLQSIKAEQFAADKIKVTLEFKDNTSGRSKKFTEVYVLANGSF